MNWYLSVLKKYAGFTGRARRKEYWMFVLFNILISFVLGIIIGIAYDGDPNGDGVLKFLSTLYMLAVFLPSIGVSIRRLHDIGRSAWTLLWLLLIPFGGAIAWIYLTAQDSQPGSNKYGPNPKNDVA